MKWTKEQHAYLHELINKHGTKWSIIASMMTERFKKKFRPEQCRSRYRMYPKENSFPVEYKETVEILPDGSHKSDKLLQMTAEQAKDQTFLLKAHGYDPNEWELTSARSNIWNVYSKQDGIQTLYSSKITVRPKQNTFDEHTLESIIDRLPTIKIPKNISEPVQDAPYIHVPLFDMHFGPADYEYYKPTQSRILYHLEKRRKAVLFSIGQDLFHNDDFRGRTASGREIDKFDMEKAFEDAWMFYVPMLEASIKNSDETYVVYSPGNHDEFAAWAFVKALEKHFGNQIHFDTRFKERKALMLGRNFIGVNHSDKKKMKRLPENFAVEFPELWSKATTREVFTGHDHKEEEIIIATDYGGIVLRKMPTGNITDDWHDSMGYTTAHKRFKIFFYDETRVIGSLYV